MKYIVLAITLISFLSPHLHAKMPNDRSQHKTRQEERKKAQIKFDTWEQKNYLPLTSCEKQSVLWDRVVSSEYKDLPSYEKLGLAQVLKMAVQPIRKKMNKESDFAPIGWKKYLHKRAVVAKVKFTSLEDHPYTGFFKGTDCALLRLSVTYRPDPNDNEPVAPGLALKAFRDGAPSANISALYTLMGQGQNYNFFEKPLSNIVPRGHSAGEKVIHWIFRKVTKYPEELNMQHMSKVREAGKVIESPYAPTQIFFVPNKQKLSFSQDYHDIRDDLLKIKKETVLYKVYAIAESDKYNNFYNYNIEDISKNLKDAQPIGEISTTSRFIASEFGDTGIFFKHEAQKNKDYQGK